VVGSVDGRANGHGRHDGRRLGRAGVGTHRVGQQQSCSQALEEQREEDLTEEGLREILDTARGTYYEALTEAEVRTFVGLGLCLSKRRLDGWLSCRYCKTNRRRTYCFQGADQVREHFVNHAAGGLGRGTEAAPAVEVEAAAVADEVAGVWAGAPPAWARGDAAARLTAARAALPRPTAAELLTTAFLQAGGRSRELLETACMPVGSGGGRQPERCSGKRHRILHGAAP
jgi:hypothetical protein